MSLGTSEAEASEAVMSDDRRTAVAYVSCFFRPDPKLPEDENQAKFEKRVQAELKEMARLREVAELCRRGKSATSKVIRFRGRGDMAA